MATGPTMRGLRILCNHEFQETAIVANGVRRNDLGRPGVTNHRNASRYLGFLRDRRRVILDRKPAFLMPY